MEAVRSIVPTDFLTGTPLLNWYYRLMGARIGANVYLGNDGGANFDHLEANVALQPPYEFRPFRC